METDARAIEAVHRVRSAIRSALDRSAREPLADVLSSPECGPAYVVKILDVHPCMGKVAGRRALRETGIAERTRLSDLAAPAREQLIGMCRCGNG